MSKHTEGPWSVESVECGDEVTGDLCILGPSPSFRFVADVSRCFQGGRIPEMEMANARLIAASPALLDSMQKYIAELDAWDGSGRSERRVATAEFAMRAAIALATGGQP